MYHGMVSLGYILDTRLYNLINYCPHRALQYAVSILQSSCPGHRGNCTYLVLSNKMASLIDLSLQLLSEVFPTHEVGGASPGSKVTSLCGGLLGILAGVVSTLATNPREELNQPLVDLIRYYT